ncbi:MAG: electron transfer flavoprotein-ubiquinone oxidoreductase, partial [Candidatus Eremiobacteraeota bacterium]|nr:electron transfer flavoprotein-ubiquinone oxidoreductase [Candidatus Eremiobacteraeota bacterium]
MAQRDVLEVDVLFVGAGPASLAGAIRLMQLAKAAGRDLEVLVIDKSGEIGSHGISGAVMDPRALDELLPDWRTLNAPVESEVTGDQLWFLTESAKVKAPIVPPMMNNHGKYVASLQKIVKWLGERAEDAG